MMDLYLVGKYWREANRNHITHIQGNVNGCYKEEFVIWRVAIG